MVEDNQERCNSCKLPFDLYMCAIAHTQTHTHTHKEMSVLKCFQYRSNWTFYYTPVILALGAQKQEGSEFKVEANLGYTPGPFLKTKAGCLS